VARVSSQASLTFIPAIQDKSAILWVFSVPVRHYSIVITRVVRKNPITTYNEPLPQSPIIVTAKAVFAVTGFIWGLCLSMKTPQLQARRTRTKALEAETPLSPIGPDVMRELDQRLERIEAILARSESTEPVPETAADQTAPPSPYVTHEELKEALGRTERRMVHRVAKQFGNQVVAVDSLRAMILDTDMLLERVLSSLDASSGNNNSGDS
jgi:hypothetical protein